MITLEEFVLSRIVLNDIVQFKTFFEGIDGPELFEVDMPPAKIYVYQGWYFIKEDLNGVYGLEISNVYYDGTLEDLEKVLWEWYISECVEPTKMMKTVLPENIGSKDEAKEFLRALHNNGEDYDLYDNPALVWNHKTGTRLFSPGEAAAMRQLVYRVLTFPGFDAHGYLLELDGHPI